MKEIDLILEILSADKAWHTVDDIADRANLSKQETAEILKFLATNQFIWLNEQGRRARIKECVDKFLTDIRDVEQG